MEYPPTGYRVKSGIIDAVLILTIFTFAVFVIDSVGGAPSWVRASIFILCLYIYDPLTIGLFGGTLGHHLMKVEVRRFSDKNKRIGLPLASLRVIAKYILGFVSILVSYSREDGRAIHDLISDSVVIYKFQDEVKVDF
jgi:uncharacterized RDD family membrane protein YckC